MPLTGHSLLHDRSEVIRERFDERRRRVLKAMLTPEIETEFHADVDGRKPRSLALRQLLNFIRMTPIEGRPFVFGAPPYQRYLLGRLHARRGEMPTLDESRSFGSRRDAIFAAFKTRLADLAAAAKRDGGNS